MSDKYEPGTKVSHAIFGLGEVKDSKPKGENYRLDIDFEDGTSKALLSTFIEIVSDDSTEEDDDEMNGENEVVEAEVIAEPVEEVVEAGSTMGKLEKLIERRNVGEVTSGEFEEMKKEILERKPQYSKEPVEIAQEEVHTDDVPRKENKDGVVSKSNIGASDDDKFAKLDRLAEIKEKGLIDDDEFKQMKKEILEK